MYNGIINIYKEKGFTSHDVVAKLRGILKQKKIGHTGTLDPQAEGVLPVCLGNAARLCDMLTEKSKEYEAVMIFGIATDTLDITGKTVRTCDRELEREEIIKAVKSFEGEYDQVPPMYSAKKINGKKLYELAREGIEVERKPVRVLIDKIDIINISEDNREIRFTVSCSKGTYIRSLCDDIGIRLGHASCMKELKRTRSGMFDLSNALTLKEIEEIVSEGKLEEHIISTENALSQYPAAYVNETGDKGLSNGNYLIRDSFRECPASVDGQLVRVYDSAGRFKALYEFDEAKQIFKVFKMFPVREI